MSPSTSMLAPFAVIKSATVITVGDPTRSQPPLLPSSYTFTYLLYVIFPVAVPSTIKEEKSSAVEFRVTVPSLVKSPETVKDPRLVYG